MDSLALLKKFFLHTPTRDQTTLMEKLSVFFSGEGSEKIFVIKGYAGTGKTSMVSAIAKTLSRLDKTTVLLAPTGRAAKVLSNYTGRKAFTVHKIIYRMKVAPHGGAYFQLKENMFKDAVFIVDEASMIPGSETNSGFSSSGNLLDDLMQFVQNGSNCKIIFIGDVAQLPPVGLLVSPALDVKYLESHFFNQKIDTITLREVVRQGKDSGILANATTLRNNLENKIKQIAIQLYADVVKVEGKELEDALNEAYTKYGRDGTMFITRSNKRAYQFNQEVRNRLLGREEEISAGDYLMVVKNNYHWLPPESEAGFIANGDMIELLKIRNIDAAHGFRFGDASFRMMDYPDQPTIEAKVILDTIASESPSLTFEQSNELYRSVAQEYKHIPLKVERNKKIKEDPYYNALQIKFGYAVTCHKAQGGQWPAVLVDQGYLTDEMINTEYLRWLYTAFTRASEKLYLVNFSDTFFPPIPTLPPQGEGL